jgi:hypothetical protein
MRVSEKQLFVLLDILKEARNFVGGFAGWQRKFIKDLYFEILNQQNDVPVEVDSDTPTSVSSPTDPDLDSSCGP